MQQGAKLLTLVRMQACTHLHTPAFSFLPALLATDSVVALQQPSDQDE
jgi:hypothetical protein